MTVCNAEAGAAETWNPKLGTLEPIFALDANTPAGTPGGYGIPAGAGKEVAPAIIIGE
jgi:hypothetical protein